MLWEMELWRRARSEMDGWMIEELNVGIEYTGLCCLCRSAAVFLLSSHYYLLSVGWMFGSV